MKNQQSNQQNSPYGEVLTKKQMKNILGGLLKKKKGEICDKTAECSYGLKCEFMPGTPSLPGLCL